MSGVLAVNGLQKSFGGIVVARDINLTLHRGRIVGLIGPNGAGKTSLFNLITGVVKPDAGAVVLDGESLNTLKFHQRIRRGLSRTWQNIRLFPSLPVIDNLLVATHDYPGERLVNILFRRTRLRTHNKAARDKAMDVLGKMGLSGVADDHIIDLPYGQQKLIGVARALMGDASACCWTANGGRRRPVHAAMQRACAGGEHGVAVCVVEQMSHSFAIFANGMFSGAIMARGSVAELIRDPQLTELYFGH